MGNQSPTSLIENVRLGHCHMCLVMCHATELLHQSGFNLLQLGTLSAYSLHWFKKNKQINKTSMALRIRMYKSGHLPYTLTICNWNVCRIHL